MKKQAAKKKSNDAAPDPRFAPVAAAFAKDARVTAGIMMASFGLKVDGKIFAMFVREEFVDERSVAAKFAAAARAGDEEDNVETFVHPATAQKRGAEEAHRKFVARQDRERRGSFARYMRRRGVPSHDYDRMMRDAELRQQFEDWRETYDE